MSPVITFGELPEREGRIASKWENGEGKLPEDVCHEALAKKPQETQRAKGTGGKRLWGVGGVAFDEAYDGLSRA